MRTADPTAITLLRFQRDVTTAALTVNAHQNFLVRLQLLADRNQIFRVFDGLLVHFLNLVMGISTFRSFRNGALVEPSNRMPL